MPINVIMNNLGFTRKFLTKQVITFGSLITVLVYHRYGYFCYFIGNIYKVKKGSFSVLGYDK